MATSVTSARVGRRAVTIEASIWVAVMTGLEWRPASADQALLLDRHLGQRHFDAEVAARDHDPAVDRVDDLGGVDRGLGALDLGDQRDVGAEAFEAVDDRGQVGGGRDEGDGEQVDPLLDGEVDPAEVGLGRRRQFGAAGDVHPLM